MNSDDFGNAITLQSDGAIVVAGESATIGIYRNGVFYLSNSNATGFADTVFVLGNNGDLPHRRKLERTAVNPGFAEKLNLAY